MTRSLPTTRSLPLALTLLIALTGCAGTIDRAIDRAGNVAERAVDRNIDRRSDRAINGAIDGAFQTGEDAVRCTYDDDACVRQARDRGDNVVLVNREGTPVDRSGAPVTEGNVEDAIVRSSSIANVSANYDFVPGERVLFEDDFSRDNVGDFPRRLEFRSGTMEIIETNAGRMLNAKTRGAFDVVLPETLPETFTIELDAQLNEFVNSFRIFPVDEDGRVAGTNFVNVDSYRGMGVGSTERGGVSALQRMRQYDQAPFTLRVMVDGGYVKVFADRERVANVPNADLGRSQRLRFDFDDVRGNPVYVGDIRIAAGGRDLYGELEAEGRVVTEGVLFDTGSATLKPESFAVVQEIAAMMEQHPDLRVRVEGHTDSSGSASGNRSLSERRAEAVRTMLVGLGVAAGRLEAAGMGSSSPIAGNDTAEGRRQNRRVELVRL